jgi:glycosyltransferase involved in cell wall biosynthesis
LKKVIRTSTIPGSLKILLKGQLKFINNYFDVIAITSGGKEFKELIENEGIRGYIVPFSRSTFSFLSDIIAFVKLLYIFKKERPYIVHSHTSKDGLLCMVAAYITKVPNRLYTIAGLADIKGIRGLLLNIAEIVTFLCATKIYPNSNNMMDIYIKKKLLKKNKAKVILNGSSNGIDLDYFCFDRVAPEIHLYKKKLNISTENFVFCFVGRVVGDKGINELIYAFDKLSKIKNDIKLIIVGTFEKKLDSIDKEVEKKIIGHPSIIYVGKQDDVRPYYAISDCLVLVSYREGMPNVVLQAGAMNLPCIVSDINGCNEIIKDEINGLIIPRKNKDLLYIKMKYLVENRKIAKQMANNARNLIDCRYKQLDLWEAILKEYNSLK